MELASQIDTQAHVCLWEEGVLGAPNTHLSFIPKANLSLSLS